MSILNFDRCSWSKCVKFNKLPGMKNKKSPVNFNCNFPAELLILFFHCTDERANMKILWSFLIIIFLIIAGCKKQPTGHELYSRVKKLEYARDRNPEHWRKLYAEAKNEHEKWQIVDAISKTRLAALLPVLADIVSEKDVADSVKSVALFAMGQVRQNAGRDYLLKVPFDSLKPKLQKAYLFALSRCCQKSDRLFFSRQLQNKELREEAELALAHCARKYHNAAFYSKLLSDSLLVAEDGWQIAYLASRAGDPQALFDLQAKVQNNSSAEKYLLKGLTKWFTTQKAKFNQALSADSLSRETLNRIIKIVLTQKSSWQSRLYALQLIPAVSDSELTELTSKFCFQQNPHLKIAAFKSLTQMNDSLAAANLMTALGKEKKPYLRAKILADLALIRPVRAYRLIMQDLGTDDRYYKAAILEALSNIKTRSARRTIRQYLQVEEPFLQLTVFEILKKWKQLTTKDVKKLLSSRDMACKTTALEWLAKRKKKLPQEELLNIYRSYSKPGDFELQRAVVKMLAQQTEQPDSAVIRVLKDYRAHPVLQSTLAKFFPAYFKDETSNDAVVELLPAALRPDSLAAGQRAKYAVIETEYGNVRLELLWEKAPLTCRNFVYLAEKHFYDGLVFHRVIPDFVVQGGDPDGTGWGGPPYLIPSEDNNVPFTRGSVGMATSGFDTGGSQFFICHSSQPHLTANYTLFARVVEGMEAVDRILPGDVIKSIKIESVK